MRWAYANCHRMRRSRPSQITAVTGRASDAANKAPGVQRVRRVEAGLDGFHERQGIAGSAPGVESLDIRRTMQQDESAADFLEVRPQDGQRAVQIVGSAFHAEPAETRCIHEKSPVGSRGVSDAANEFR